MDAIRRKAHSGPRLQVTVGPMFTRMESDVRSGFLSADVRLEIVMYWGTRMRTADSDYGDTISTILYFSG